MPEHKEYGPLELPSGKKIHFRAPLTGDRLNITQMMDMSADKLAAAAMLIDEYVALKCITKVDGNPAGGDYKHLASNWFDSDMMFYNMVFNEMFGGGEGVRDRAKEAARFLLTGQTSTAGCNSPTTVMSPGQTG